MDHLAQIGRESDTFLTEALHGSMDVPVPTCPGWTMTDLVGHLGQVQHFHGGHLTRGVTDPPSGPRPEPPATGLAGWFREGTVQLLHNLRALGPDAPAWTFGPGPKTCAFWRRRMAHEAAVHRWDAQFARGEAAGFDVDFAIDGINEYLEVFLARRRRHEEPPAGTLVVAPREGVPVEVVSGDPTAARAELHDTAERLYLVLWGRIDLTDVDVDGDLDLARSAVNV